MSLVCSCSCHCHCVISCATPCVLQLSRQCISAPAASVFRFTISSCALLLTMQTCFMAAMGIALYKLPGSLTFCTCCHLYLGREREREIIARQAPFRFSWPLVLQSPEDNLPTVSTVHFDAPSRAEPLLLVSKNLT